MKNIKYLTFVTPMRISLSDFNDYLSVKGGIRLINLIKGALIIIGMAVTPSRIRIIVVVLRRLSTLYKHNGPKGVVLFLKTAAVSLQQSLGGMKIRNPRDISKTTVSLTTSGIPRIIPALDRERIRNGDTNVIKFWLTILNLYRVLSYEGKVNMNTITDDSTGTHVLDQNISGMIPNFVNLFVRSRFSVGFLKEVISRASENSFRVIMKSAPGTSAENGTFSSQAHIMFLAVNTIIRKGFLLGALFTIMNSTGNSLGLQILKTFMDLNHALHDRGVHLLGAMLPEVGKLGFKEEAAGKIRVFAMVDGFTQAALAPIHDLIFRILEDVPTDGTFNQMRPILRMVHTGQILDLKSRDYVGSKERYSLDLSAATDRLPVDLQQLLLEELFKDLVPDSKQFAGAWALLLVGRGYKAGNMSPAPGVWYYHVGQPMGALSSWASLALTHHFIVQAAAWLSGHTPMGQLYMNYSILGDDLVIGDAKVKDMYLQILDSLGVKCGIHKSLLSPNGTAMEFAKRTIYKGVDVSPIPFKEMVAGMQSIAGFTSIVNKYNLPTHKALQAFGFGFKTYSNLNKPLGKLNAKARALILALSIPTTVEEVKTMFQLGAPKVPRFVSSAIATAKVFLQVEIPRLRLKAHTMFVEAESFSMEGRSRFETDLLLQRHISKAQEVIDDLQIKYDVKPTQWGLNKINTLKAELELVKSDDTHDLITEAFYLYNRVVYRPIINRLGASLVKIEHIIKAIKANGDFEHSYMAFIEASRELALLNASQFSEVRIDPDEEFRGLFDSISTRLWKRWSPMLQGSAKVEDNFSIEEFPNIVYRVGYQDQPW